MRREPIIPPEAIARALGLRAYLRGPWVQAEPDPGQLLAVLPAGQPGESGADDAR